MGQTLMKIVFLDAGTIGSDIDVSIFSKLGDLTVYDKSPQELTSERIKDANVVITNKMKLTAEVLSGAKELELVCVTATGFDNVDVDYAKKNGIAVCNVKGYSTDSVAQITVSTVLSLFCNLASFDSFCKSGKYTQSGVHNKLEPVFHEIAGKIWGIYGFGNIGKRVAKVAEALGCKILVCKKTPVADYECVSLKELFEKSDIITLHTPLNDETKFSVNENILSKAKKELVLVNAARGAVTDEKAVADAVISGKIAAFGTDVYSVEPMSKENPLYALRDRENVIFTPHMAWGAYEARVRLMDEVYENIQCFYNGKTRNRVDL